MVETNQQRNEKLTARQERLLSKLHDNECRVVERFLAERLVARSSEARRFLESLGDSRRVVVARTARTEKVDLWSGISARIAQEERAEVFLGKRRATLGERLVGFVREHRQVAWGIPSGAAVAAVILLFVAPPNPEGDPAPFSVAKSGAVRAPVVNLASTGGVGRRQPVEVDWVRGSGRVRVMQDPSRNSAIIWVRRPQSPNFLPGERFVAPTPFRGAPAQSTFGGYPR